MPTSSSTWNRDVVCGPQAAGSTQASAPADAQLAAPACDDLEEWTDHPDVPSAPGIRLGLPALFAFVAVCGVLTFALINLGEGQVATAVATVLAVVVLAAPPMMLAARGGGPAATYVAVFLLLGGLGAGLITSWFVYSVRVSRSLNETDDLRQIGGAIMFRQDTGRSWQGLQPPLPANDPSGGLLPMHADPTIAR